MLRVGLGVIFIVLVVVEGYYYDEYFPEEKSFRSKKGDDDFAPIYVEDESRPGRWLRLKQRSQAIVEASKRRADSYRQQRTYRDYRKASRQSGRYQGYTKGPRTNVYDWSSASRQSGRYQGYTKGPRTNVYDWSSDNRQRTYQGYTKGPPRTNVYNQKPVYEQDEYSPPYRHQNSYGQQSGWKTYKETYKYVKGPRTRPEDEYGRQSVEKYVYPQETVEVTARRYINGKPYYTDEKDKSLDKTRKRNAKKKRVNRKSTKARQSTSSSGYAGCIDSGLYCDYWKSIGCCTEPLGQKFCRKTCGLCSPQQTICPSSYKFGCCWNGNEALKPDKSDCPDCRDISTNICHNPDIVADCDLHLRNSLVTRSLCPVTCGACFDYSESQPFGD